jgi:mono/diheme cytochrome c family protein
MFRADPRSDVERRGDGVRAGRRAVACVLLAGACVLAAGCEKVMRDMYDQPRYKPLAASTLWRAGAASRPPIDGAVARAQGRIAGASSGRVAQARARDESALDVLRRGRERYDIYCSPCHSVAGDGDGMIVRRGFPSPPSFHIERLRDATDDYLRSVIRDGHGAMYSYATRVDAADRVAIVAYIRALQRAWSATLADVPDDRRGALR